MTGNQSHVLDLYAISLLALSTKKSLDLYIQKLQPYKIVTLLKLWEYNMQFNQ